MLIHVFQLILINLINMTTYQAPKYIADLQFDTIPANADWKGVSNPLTVYDRIDATREKYRYPDLYDRFDNISINGKKSLGAALFEWIVNRLDKDYGDDILYFYPVVQVYWASGIDRRYGSCNVPDLEYELIINYSERDGRGTNWVASQWPAEGDLQNILYVSIAFTANLNDVVDGPDEWLGRLYYLALYLIPDDNKPAFQKWFSTALDRLEKYTPNRATTGQYEDLFDEHWLENRGLPVPPQLFDPEFDYRLEDNTELVNNFLKGCDYNENNYLNNPDDLIEGGFEGEPYVFEGVISKEKKSVDIKSLVSDNEDFSSVKTAPSIIKASSKEVDPDLEYDYYWLTDDRDGLAVVENPKLAHILAEIKGRAQFGLTLAASEWIVNILRESTDTDKVENLIESMWAGIDPNYIKPFKVYPYYDGDEEDLDNGDEEEDESEYTDILKGLYYVLAYANNYFIRDGVDSTDPLHIIVLARNMYKDKTVFDAWIHNTVGRIMADYPKTDEDEENEDKVSHTPIISRNYYFDIDAVYNESSEKEKSKAFINHLDYKKNTFLPTPEEVYLMSYVRDEVNENPYNQDFRFSKEITAERISTFGNDLSGVKIDKLALKCFDIAEKLDPNDRFSYAYRGVYYYNRKEYQLAIDYLSKAAQLNAKAGTFYYIGASYYELEDYDKAYDTFIESINLDEKIRNEDQVKYLAKKFVNLAAEANRNEQYELCIELATKAITLDPKNSDGYVNRVAGYGNMNDKEDFDERAKADIETIRKLNPKGSALTYSNEGLKLINDGKYEEAIEKANIALQIDPKLAHGYFIRGYAYGAMEIFDKASADMSKAVELNPKDELALVNNAYYLRRFGKFEEAVEQYTIAIEIMPETKTVIVYDNRGKAYAALGRFDKALEDWLVAYNYSKTFTEFVYVILGYASKGNIAKTKELLDKSFAMENDLTNGDDLMYNFIQYALQVNTKQALAQCQQLLDAGKTNVDYPIGKLVEEVIGNGHPDKETLTEIAKKINNVSTLK